jgi:tetratricopeptide (TPR) repeat protein
MSPSAKKPVLVRRTVVELDLVGYSLVARDLEKQADATVLFHLNDQVQGFVDDGLREAGCARKDVVNGTAGDNALLAFERATEAHLFSEAVHRATAKYNATKTDSAAQRHFRIGVSTGKIAVRGKEISGTHIIDSVRLEAAGKKGHILIDEATYEELPGKLQQLYVGPEVVADKQNNSYSVYRCIVSGASDARVFAPGTAQLRKDSDASAGSSCPVDISRIIKYAPAELIGREAETKLLNDVWDKAVRGETKRPHVLTFVALGGEGKTSLVAKWAAHLAYQGWPGCDAVLAWSFYSQGTREQTAVSSDLFLAEALTFFGDAEMAGSAQGAFDKGRRLAQLVGEQRVLLILDGLEPLQYAPTSPTPGELKDAGIAALLKGLAANSHGLCVVTTRYSIPDLKAFWQTTAPEVKLLRLSRDHGVQLLKTHGVTGSDRRNIALGDGKGMVSEFEKLVEDVDGHALTLHIMGSFLKKALRGDIRCRDRVTFEKASQKTDDGHAFRAMAAYSKWMEDGSDEAKRELAVLRLLGLFDRPATADCIQALLEEPAIPGLTEPLVGLAEDDWNCSLDSLETAKLITVNRAASAMPHSALRIPHSLDAHPLLREYFGQRLREQQPEAWRAAHRRLYEHLCATTKEVDQPTLEDLQPLYQAVAHGCQAGLSQEACDEVYFARIVRGKENYSAKKLGAFGSDLGAVACFVETPWSRVSTALTEADQAWLLNEAAFRLRALGRLTEALEPMRAGLEMRVKQGVWKSTAIIASNLSELELTLGEVAGAVADAEQSVTYADRSGDAFVRMAFRATHGDALHQAGRRAEAEARFREAEHVQAERQPDYPLLYSLPGFQYCDLLLTEAERAAWQTMLECGDLSPLSAGDLSPSKANQRAEANERPMRGSAGPTNRPGEESGDKSPHSKTLRAVSERGEKALQLVLNGSRSLLDIALNHLTLGCATLYAAVLSSDSPSSFVVAPGDEVHSSGTVSTRSASTSDLESAVSGLRRAGTAHELPRGLLTRAWARFVTDARTGPESAQADLDEAWEIAERGPMRLHMADIHLYRARLFHAMTPYPWTSPQEDLAAARKLIEQCGYWRRKEELEDAEAAAKNW